MKIVLTGYNGFIGKNILKFYKNRSFVLYDKSQDITETLTKASPDLVINCACEIYDPTRMWHSNVDLVTKIVKYCETSNARLVHFGSSSEYGVWDEPTSEQHALRGTGAYANSKKAATYFCLRSKANVIIIRPYSPYGWGEKPKRLFPALARSFLRNEPMQLKQGVHDFCFIDDFIRGVDLVINTHVSGVFNISSGIQISNLEVLDAFQRCTRKQGKVTVTDEMSTPNVWQCDNSLIRSLGWSPAYTLEQGIEKFLSTYEL